jgi:hypothetical protein
MWHILVAIPTWLQEHGYRESPKAWEAGKSGPPGLERDLVFQATVHRSHKAFVASRRLLAPLLKPWYSRLPPFSIRKWRYLLSTTVGAALLRVHDHPISLHGPVK